MLRNIFATILILVAVGIVIFWARPLWEESKKIAAEKSDLNRALAEFRKLRKVRDEVLTTYNALSREDLEKLGKLLPPGPQSGTLLVNLDNLSRQSGVLLKKVEIRERKEGAPALPGQEAFEKLPVELTVAASYEAFGTFLDALEGNLRLLDIQELSFTVSPANTHEFQIKAQAYYASF